MKYIFQKAKTKIMKSKTTFLFLIITVTTFSFIGCGQISSEKKSATMEELGQMNRDFAGF